VDRIGFIGGMTNMTGGLKVARMEVFGRRNEERQNVERIIVLITDGHPSYSLSELDEEVATIKRMGIRIVGLGITNGVCQLLIRMCECCVLYEHFSSIMCFVLTSAF